MVVGESSDVRASYPVLMCLVGRQIIDKEEIAKQNMLGPLKREITITKRLSHPNIVNMKEVMATKDKVYIFLELVPGGELFDKIVADGPLKVLQTRT